VKGEAGSSLNQERKDERREERMGRIGFEPGKEG